MALTCDYTTPDGLTITNAYCKVCMLGLNEYTDLDGTRSAFVTVGIWSSADHRTTQKKAPLTHQIRIANGWRQDDVGEEQVEDNKYDEVYGVDVLSGDGVNPVKATYDYIKTLPEFSTNQVDV